jgi:hypothetical protein
MMKEIYMSLEDVYTAERKALVRAACDDLGQSYMHGICAVVAQLESDLLDAKNSGARQTERSWQDDVEA